jgi:hypothetical protein
LLTQYVWQRQTLAQLACEYGRSERWVQRQLERAEPSTKLPRPEPIIAIMDTTYFGRGYELIRCVMTEVNLDQNTLDCVVSDVTEMLTGIVPDIGMIASVNESRSNVVMTAPSSDRLQ